MPRRYCSSLAPTPVAPYHVWWATNGTQNRPVLPGDVDGAGRARENLGTAVGVYHRRSSFHLFIILHTALPQDAMGIAWQFTEIRAMRRHFAETFCYRSTIPATGRRNHPERGIARI